MVGDVFVAPERTVNDGDKTGFGGAWGGKSSVDEEVAGGMDVVLDSVGSDGGAVDGFPLDEGDGVTSEEVVLGCRGRQI